MRSSCPAMDTSGATASGAETDGPAPPTLLNRIEGEGTRAFSIWTNTTVQLERLQKDIAHLAHSEPHDYSRHEARRARLQALRGDGDGPADEDGGAVQRRALPRTCFIHHVRGVAGRALHRRRVHEDASGAHGARDRRAHRTGRGRVQQAVCPVSASAAEVSGDPVGGRGVSGNHPFVVRMYSSTFLASTFERSLAAAGRRCRVLARSTRSIPMCPRRPVYGVLGRDSIRNSQRLQRVELVSKLSTSTEPNPGGQLPRSAVL